MNRRTFLGTASSAFIANAVLPSMVHAQAQADKLNPMALGLLVSPFGNPEATIRRVHDLEVLQLLPFLFRRIYWQGIHC